MFLLTFHMFLNELRTLMAVFKVLVHIFDIFNLYFLSHFFILYFDWNQGRRRIDNVFIKPHGRNRVADWEVTERCDILGNILRCYYFSIWPVTDFRLRCDIQMWHPSEIFFIHNLSTRLMCRLAPLFNSKFFFSNFYFFSNLYHRNFYSTLVIFYSLTIRFGLDSGWFCYFMTFHAMT